MSPVEREIAAKMHVGQWAYLRARWRRYWVRTAEGSHRIVVGTDKALEEGRLRRPGRSGCSRLP